MPSRAEITKIRGSCEFVDCAAENNKSCRSIDIMQETAIRKTRAQRRKCHRPDARVMSEKKLAPEVIMSSFFFGRICPVSGCEIV